MREEPAARFVRPRIVHCALNRAEGEGVDLDDDGVARLDERRDANRVALATRDRTLGDRRRDAAVVEDVLGREVADLRARTREEARELVRRERAAVVHGVLRG